MHLSLPATLAIAGAVHLAAPGPGLAQSDPPGATEPSPAPVSAPGDGETPVCPDDIRALAQQVIVDAQRRSTLAPANAGHDGSFFLAWPDQGFRLNLGGYTQFRYTMNFRDNDDGADTFDSGFDVERTRLIFAGQLAEPKVDFLLLPGAGSGGTWSIYDAWVRHTFDNGWSIKVGQGKVPFSREYLVSERFLLSAERSSMNAAFSAVYTKGIEACHTGDVLGFHVSFNNGARTLHEGFTSAKLADYAATARAEIKLAGQWKQLFDFTAHGNTEPASMLGFGVHHQGHTGDFAGRELDSLTQYTADVSYEGIDWSVFGAFIGRHAVISDEGTRNEFGLAAQGALLLTEDFEVFSRYALLVPDRDVAGDDPFNAVTAGCNYYFHGQSAKLTFDVIWYLDPTTDTDILGFGPSPSIGLLRSSEPNQVAIQVQFQLIF